MLDQHLRLDQRRRRATQFPISCLSCVVASLITAVEQLLDESFRIPPRVDFAVKVGFHQGIGPAILAKHTPDLMQRHADAHGSQGEGGEADHCPCHRLRCARALRVRVGDAGIRKRG